MCVVNAIVCRKCHWQELAFYFAFVVFYYILYTRLCSMFVSNICDLVIDLMMMMGVTLSTQLIGIERSQHYTPFVADDDDDADGTQLIFP